MGGGKKRKNPETRVMPLSFKHFPKSHSGCLFAHHENICLQRASDLLELLLVHSLFGQYAPSSTVIVLDDQVSHGK